MIGKSTEAILNRAIRTAVARGHEYFTLEHVFLAMLDETEVIEILEACSADIEDLRKGLEKHLDDEVPKLSTEDRAQAGEPTATLSIQRLIQRALFHVQSAGKDEIQPKDLLVALFQSRDSQSLFLLSKQEIERIDVINYISHGIRKDADDPADPGEEEDSTLAGGANDDGGGASGGKDPLKLYTVDLTERAELGKIDPLVGRKNELERMVQVLCRRRKNNPLLVGEAGVGKTALAEGLALRVHAGEVPSLLKNTAIYSLDMGSLLAGTKFRGDFEQRLKRVVDALKKLASTGKKAVLFIDEIHTIVGAGSVSGGSLDAANILKPILTQGEILCIGSTTYNEYRSVFEKDHALARRFQKIDVPEPTPDEAIQILNGLKSKFEEHHGVIYQPDAIRAMVELSSRHLADRQLPDKAIDVMDEVGSKARLARPDDSTETTRIGVTAVEEVISQIARVPPRSVSVSQKDRLKNLDRDLKLAIFGQDTAIEAVVTSILLARSGLRSGEKPVGSFLFTGPTGVGKTELAKQLAHALGIPFLRFDMSEYMEKHTVSRLIGAPPGYVGFEQAGLLTDGVLKNPHSIVLLDEIEKAHSDLWNILLQVMDHGTLTDNNGRKADFRNVILLMTSNVGSRDLERRPLGMNSDSTAGLSAAQKAIEATFTPEFRNRLDAIVQFNPLSPLTIAQVVGKQLLELEHQLLEKQVELEVDEEVRAWLGDKGYDRRMGARPMGRLIQDTLKKPLANEILFGKLEHGGRVRTYLKDGKVEFEFKKKKKGSAPATESRGEVSGNASS